MTVAIPTPDDVDLLRVSTAIRQLASGRSNATGTVTLATGVTTTTVTNVNCSIEAQILLSPKTANAAGAVATTFVSAVANGSFTLTHANLGTTDRTFGYVFLG